MDTLTHADRRLGEEALVDVYRAQSVPLQPLHTQYNYEAHLNQFVAPNWSPQPSETWNASYPTPYTSQFNWQATTSTSDVLTEQTALYTSQEQNLPSPHYKYEHSPSFNAGAPYSQPYVSPIDQVSPGFGTASPSQTSQPYTHPLYTNIPRSDETDYSPHYSPHYSFGPDTHPKMFNETWLPMGDETNRTTHVTSDPFPELHTSEEPSKGLTLDWSTSDQASKPSVPAKSTPYQTIVPKRKHSSPEPPVAKQRRSTSGQDELDEFVVVFENAPGALATVKRRKKLDAPVRKAARDVRAAGACHQCRFRKRTCSTGTPCNSCLKNGHGLHELKCQRESPFIGKPMHLYFEYSSTKRVVSFDIRISQKTIKSLQEEMVTIDGIGRLSHPIQLRARRRPLSSFKPEEREIIIRTQDPKKAAKSRFVDLEHVLIFEDQTTLGTQIEQWAVEYSSKFVHAAGPKFASTTAAVILGTAYIKKGLPESALIAAMIRVASIAFILRAGVKCDPESATSKSSPYRTLQATIDTILYERLKIAEKDLFKMLQRIVFRSAGYLAREQVYPVGLVLWQLLRILCIGASHLSNLVDRFKNKATEQADYQFHALKLVLSTHLALFRSSNPLLFDFNDKVHQDLLCHDEELLDLAKKMRKVVVGFRAKGFPDMKGSIAYKKNYFDLFRRVYDGL